MNSRVLPKGEQSSATGASTARRQEVAARPFGFGKPLIQRGERQPQRLGNGHVPRVVARDVMTKLPNSIREWIEGEQLDIELHQILVGRIGFRRRYLLGSLQSAQDIGGFDECKFGGI